MTKLMIEVKFEQHSISYFLSTEFGCSDVVRSNIRHRKSGGIKNIDDFDNVCKMCVCVSFRSIKLESLTGFRLLLSK